MNKEFDFIIIGAGPAGCVTANFLSKSYRVALIDIAQEKKSDSINRSFPTFISSCNFPYTPAYSGVLGGNSDLWSGKIYLISEKECSKWPIKHDDLLQDSKSLAGHLNISHDSIYNLEVRSNSTFYHRSKRSKLKNLFDTFSIRDNPKVELFTSATIKNFNFDKSISKISSLVINVKGEVMRLEVQRAIIISAGGLGSIALVHQALIDNPNLDYSKIIYPLHDHAHYSIELYGGTYQKRLEKGYIKNRNSEFEDCLVFHKNNEMVAIQIDGGYTPPFIQKMRAMYLRTDNIILKNVLNFFKCVNFIFKLAKKFLLFKKTTPYEFFFSENTNSGKIKVKGNRTIGYTLDIHYLENKDQKQELFRKALKELRSDIGYTNIKNLPLPYVGLHPSGSIPMRDEYELGSVDKNLSVYGIENLYTVGSHVFPQNGVTNPTWTIMTLAYRLAMELLKNNSKTK